MRQGVLYSLYSDGMVRKMEGSDMRVTLAIPHPKDQLPRVLAILDSSLLAVGLSNGALLIYETSHGTESQRFHVHIADILSIVAVPTSNGGCNSIYYSGSDSRIVHLTKIDGQYVQGSQDRGQSHDVNSLTLLSPGILISAGLSTDICIYQLDPTGAFLARHFGTSTRRLRHCRQVYDVMMTKSVQ